MKEKEAVDLRFFRLLLPGFSKRLPLPENFYKHISMNENRKTASLVNYNGKIRIWHVDFYKEKEQMYIEGRGWEDFIQANALKDFYMLIFRYRGNMIFTFKVFNEKNYITAHKNNMKEKVILTDHDCENSDNIQNSTKRSCKERKCDDLTDSLSNRFTPRSVRQHVVNGKDHDTSKTRATSPEVQNTSSTTGIYFDVTISALHLTGHCLYLRKDDIKFTVLEKLNEVTLRDHNGRHWPVTLRHYERIGKKMETYMTIGLRRFCRMNSLKEGDKCIFEAKGNCNMLGVKIIRR